MKALEHWLAEREMTQDAFGKLLGVKQATVSDYLSGNITPKLPKLKKISKITGLSFDELLGNKQGNGGGMENRAVPG